jgi:hypothetical protein
MITIPGTSDHHHLEFMITIVERLITIPGMREASNRSRVTDLSPSTARDLFEAGLNEAAHCVMSAYQPSTGTGPTLSEPHLV